MTSCYNKYFTKPFKVSESHRKILNKMRELGEKILEREGDYSRFKRQISY